MAGKVRFYRGEQGTSLPATRQNGAIFIIERFGSDSNGYSVGDMYVDMDNGNRLHIIPDKEIIKYNSSTMSNVISQKGQTYIFQEENPQKIGIAVGDGSSYIGDLPVWGYEIKEKIKEAVKQKVNAYLGTEYLGLGSEKLTADTIDISQLNKDPEGPAETLVLTRELWLDF